MMRETFGLVEEHLLVVGWEYVEIFANFLHSLWDNGCQEGLQRLQLRAGRGDSRWQGVIDQEDCRQQCLCLWKCKILSLPLHVQMILGAGYVPATPFRTEPRV